MTTLLSPVEQLAEELLDIDFDSDAHEQYGPSWWHKQPTDRDEWLD